MNISLKNFHHVQEETDPGQGLLVEEQNVKEKKKNNDKRL
jgi:hypothetical protein